MQNNLPRPLSISIDLAEGTASAYVVLDSSIGNTSSGGLRITDDLRIEEIQTLAREMTLKFSFIGLPRGGAKSGIRIQAGTSPEEKRCILKELGQSLRPVISTGIYYPGMDMNCGPDDLRALYEGAGITLPEKATDTSYFTAISVANAIYACSQEVLPATRPLTVAIEGFGSVGCYLASRLPADQFRIVALSTVKGAVACDDGFPPQILQDARKAHGDQLVHHLSCGAPVAMDAVLTAEVDILVPAARTWSIHSGNVAEIRAKVIVPAANAPYTIETIDILHRMGVVALPGFVTNSGGVYASSLYDSGVSTEEIEDISSRLYRPAVAALLCRSHELDVSPVTLAERVALRRLKTRLGGGSGETKADRLVKRLMRKGLVPRSVYGRRFAVTFTENLKQLERQIREER